MKTRLGFIGAGSMSEALLHGFRGKYGYPSELIFVTNKDDDARLRYFQETFQCRTTNDKELLVKNSDVLFLLMKPKDIQDALQEIKPFITDNHVIVSVVAGVKMSTIVEGIERHIPIIRVMPNTSATIGLAATGFATNEYVTEAISQLAFELFQSVGYVANVTEEQLDAVTGLSGSGPAFLYHFTEGFIQGGEAAGLPPHIVKDLAYYTILGAATMLMESGKTPATLREEVTSPNGTTQAGLNVLGNYDFTGIIEKCIVRATERSRELSEVATKK